MTDQQRWDALGVNGGWVKSPNIDQLAATGVNFSNCYTNSPVCAPARVALASGLYPHNHGLWHNRAYDLPSNMFTWMKAVRNAGYRTSLFGKAHLRKRHHKDIRKLEHFMNSYGFDDVDEIVGPRACAITLSHMTARWKERGCWDAYIDDYKQRFIEKPHMARPSPLPLDLYADVYIADRAVDYLESYNREKPWCMMLSFGGPHEPWDAPEPYSTLHAPEDMPLAREWDCSVEELKESSLRDKFTMAGPLEKSDIAALRANYAGNINLIDAQVGRVLDLLERRGEHDNTWIFFTSDHGELNGDYGMLYKNNFFDGAARVPLIIQPPKSAQIKKIDAASSAMVEMFDIGATMVDIVGAKLPKNYFAKSLLPLVSGEVQSHRDFCLVEFKGELMYVDQQWKMAINKKGEPYLLINRESDPEESRNLVDKGYQFQKLEFSRKLMQRLLLTQNTQPLSAMDATLVSQIEPEPLETKSESFICRFLAKFS
jgi:choline-sulfatase